MSTNNNQSWLGSLLNAFGASKEQEQAPRLFENMSPEELERAYFQGDEATRAAIKKVRDSQQANIVQQRKIAQMKGKVPPPEQGPIDAALAGRRSLLDALSQPASPKR
jgi:hypothetical protein